MENLRTLVNEIVQKKLTALGVAIPADLEYSVEEVEQAILNYCNISQVPSELKFTWAGMVVDYVRWETAIRKSSESPAQSGDAQTFLSNLKEGDVTLGFSQVSSSAVSSGQASNAHAVSNVLDQVVMNYRDALNRFRRLVW